jgi:CTP synthase (UTP-ammonia lyase)
MKRIALVGDYSETIIAHRAIPIALELAVKRAHVEVGWEWRHSSSLAGAAVDSLDPYDGIWCVPGSPYENMRGVLDAIRFARETGRPFLGTCGGFQHALIEYAENVWHIPAAHAETDPAASDPVIAPLACALVDVQGLLRFAPASRLRRIYGEDTAAEEYHCSYGLNPSYAQRLLNGPLKAAAFSEDGIRAFELDDHPFFVGTLFQPERAALKGRMPPLVHAFVVAIAAT